jgi:hypothetical protein
MRKIADTRACNARQAFNLLQCVRPHIGAKRAAACRVTRVRKTQIMVPPNAGSAPLDREIEPFPSLARGSRWTRAIPRRPA